MELAKLYFNIIPVLGFLAVIIIGVIVYLGDRKTKVTRLWFLTCISAALWSGFLFLTNNAPTKDLGLLLRIFMDSFGILVVLFWLRFIVAFLGVERKLLIRTVTICTILMLIFNTTPWFVKDLVPKYGFNYYVEANVGYFIFAVYFSIVIVLGLILLTKEKQRASGVRLYQIKNVFVGSIVGFIGGSSTFLYSLGVPLPPYLLFLFTGFPLIIGRGIVKYNLFNLKLILVELAVFLLNMFLLFNVFTSHATTDLVLNISVSAFVFLFSVVLMRGIYKDIRDRERIEGLVKEMEIANEKLRMLEGQKTEFVSIASHQLRTPLTVIKGYASMVLEGTFGAISDSVRDAMDKLYKSSERIVSLVEDLLTASRIEQGRMMLVFETINLKDLVQNVLEETQAAAAEAKIDFSFTAEEGKELLVAVDEKKFKQVVRHILDNAIKYTPAPGSVHVTVADDSLTKKVRLTISDTGLGMTTEQITAIFERFNLKVGGEVESQKVLMAEPRTSRFEVESEEGVHESSDSGEGEGSRSEESKAMGDNRTPGIGLYIAQEIIEAHHGTIRIESAGPDRGTTVVVELPRATQ